MKNARLRCVAECWKALKQIRTLVWNGLTHMFPKHRFWCFKGVKKRCIRNKWVNRELLKISISDILFNFYYRHIWIRKKGCVWSAIFYFCGDTCLWEKPKNVCVITMTFVIGFYVEMSLKITSSQMPNFLASQQISFVSLIWWQLIYVLISD